MFQLVSEHKEADRRDLMPQLINLAVVRAHLNREREWAAYAIGDLSPGLVDKCEWRVSTDVESALLRVLTGSTRPSRLRWEIQDICVCSLTKCVRPGFLCICARMP